MTTTTSNCSKISKYLERAIKIQDEEVAYCNKDYMETLTALIDDAQRAMALAKDHGVSDPSWVFCRTKYLEEIQGRKATAVATAAALRKTLEVEASLANG